MEHIDNRSDIFAVGIVLHEVLTGRRLFKSRQRVHRRQAGAGVRGAGPLVGEPRGVRPVDRHRHACARAERRGALPDGRRDGRGSREGAVRDAGVAARAAQVAGHAVPPRPVRARARSSCPFTPSPVATVDGDGTPRPAATRASSSKVTAADGPLEIDLGIWPRRVRSRRPARRRGAAAQWLALGALGGAVVAFVVLAQSPRGQRQEVTVAPSPRRRLPGGAPSQGGAARRLRRRGQGGGDLTRLEPAGRAGHPRGLRRGGRPHAGRRSRCGRVATSSRSGSTSPASRQRATR